MAKNEISVRLEGEDEDIDFSIFADFCASLLRALGQVEEAVTGKKSVRYKITGLEHGSACLTIRAFPKRNSSPWECREVTSVFRKTISDIKRNSPADERLGHSDLTAFADLANPVNRKSYRVKIGSTLITRTFGENAKNMPTREQISEGNVIGYIERLDIHGKQQFDLFPAYGGRVSCEFDDSLMRDVVRVVEMRSRVAVKGTLRYRRNGLFPFAVLAREIEEVPSDSQLPTLSSLRGFAPNCTSGVESVAFIRAIRDEEN